MALQHALCEADALEQRRPCTRTSATTSNFYLHTLKKCLEPWARGGTETPSKPFANHNALGQLTNHNTFSFSEGGPSSNPELIEPFVPDWGERYCNNVIYRDVTRSRSRERDDILAKYFAMFTLELHN